MLNGDLITKNPTFELELDVASLLSLKPLNISVTRTDIENSLNLDTEAYFARLDESQLKIERELKLEEGYNLR